MCKKTQLRCLCLCNGHKNTVRKLDQYSNKNIFDVNFYFYYIGSFSNVVAHDFCLFFSVTISVNGKVGFLNFRC